MNAEVLVAFDYVNQNTFRIVNFNISVGDGEALISAVLLGIGLGLRVTWETEEKKQKKERYKELKNDIESRINKKVADGQEREYALIEAMTESLQEEMRKTLIEQDEANM